MALPRFVFYRNSRGQMIGGTMDGVEMTCMRSVEISDTVGEVPKVWIEFIADSAEILPAPADREGA